MDWRGRCSFIFAFCFGTWFLENNLSLSRLAFKLCQVRNGLQSKADSAPPPRWLHSENPPNALHYDEVSPLWLLGAWTIPTPVSSTHCSVYLRWFYPQPQRVSPQMCWRPEEDSAGFQSSMLLSPPWYGFLWILAILTSPNPHPWPQLKETTELVWVPLLCDEARKFSVQTVSWGNHGAHLIWEINV